MLASRSHLILALLFAPDVLGRLNAPIAGVSRLQKYVFLVTQETQLLSHLKGQATFAFRPHKMGPFSGEVYDELAFLDLLDLITGDTSPGRTEDNAVEVFEYRLFCDEQALVEQDRLPIPRGIQEFTLTSKGMKVGRCAFEALPESDRSFLVALKRQFSGLSLATLLRHIYTKYPEYTTDSKIGDYIGIG